MLNDIFESTSKPLVFDGDNGGKLEHIKFLVRSLERLGVSALCIEDKIGEKKNSLFKDQKNIKQDKIINFCKKIEKAKESAFSNEFCVIARIESLILGKGINDAIKRAVEYSKSGADLILIHSNKKNFSEIKNFAKKFSDNKYFKPLVAVPSSYSSTKEDELIKNNIKVVIYANQLMRAAHMAMYKTANKILKSGCSSQSEKSISKIKDIISYIK
jgi:phosphoenolpyruvate phosphomutase / 2-hydroxyethylphosphonate cytidylyltransferase